MKILPRWLIKDNQFKKQQKTGNKQGFAIVITIREKFKTKHLCASELQFEGILRAVKKY